MRRQRVWCCRWRRRIPPGAMIASWVPWPILASGYRTRRWATSCVATESLLPPNENTRPAGRISSALIWMFWRERISSRWKCLRSKAWLPTTCCSLSSWRVGGFVWPESRPYGQETHLRVQGRGVYQTEGSCRFPLIVLQQTTQSFLATHNSVIPAHSSIRQGEQQSVLLALVIAFLVVMDHILLQGSAQRPLPEQDQLRQAFLFHRSHPAFRIGVQIRTPRW